jgi:ATP-dependent protease ClpP protease subunit
MLKQELKNLDNLMDKIYKIYIDYSKLTQPELEEILKKDELFDANKALECGLIKEIY